MSLVISQMSVPSDLLPVITLNIHMGVVHLTRSEGIKVDIGVAFVLSDEEPSRQDSGRHILQVKLRPLPDLRRAFRLSPSRC